MQVDECFQLGHVIKPKGLHGEIVVFLDVDIPENYRNLDAVFIEKQGQLEPYFVERIEIGQSKSILKLVDVNSYAKAEAMKSGRLYLPLDMLPQLNEGQFYYHQIIGYQVNDIKKGKMGTVKQIIALPGNDLIAFDHEGKEVLFPIKDEILLKVDHHNKELSVELPDGLLKIYI